MRNTPLKAFVSDGKKKQRKSKRKGPTIQQMKEAVRRGDAPPLTKDNLDWWRNVLHKTEEV